MCPRKPLCGAPTERDRALDSERHGPGWRCIVHSYAHLYQARYGHLKEWFTRNRPKPLVSLILGPLVLRPKDEGLKDPGLRPKDGGGEQLPLLLPLVLRPKD